MNPADSSRLRARLPSRRRVVAAMGATGAAVVTGKGWGTATPIAPGGAPAPATLLRPQIRKAAGAPAFCVDVHAHFFNASDVPVRGFLQGPVAHDMQEPGRSLVRALAPFADKLARLAPTASAEIAELRALAGQTALQPAAVSVSALQARLSQRRAALSAGFYDLVRGSGFERQYNAIQQGARSLRVATAAAPADNPMLDRDSVARALELANPAVGPEPSAAAQRPYANGVLVFIGYMLSSRWMNLQTYAQAYSSGPEAFGIDLTLGALVDFDHWLGEPPRSSHDDQVALQELLSDLSGGYMRPLVAYNPWTDVVERGRATERVIDAVVNRGYVGVKIYPPNGYWPYGNTTLPAAPTAGAPSAADLDAALGKFWDACADLGIPVMVHSDRSMGLDDAHDALGGPQGLQALFERYRGRPAPRIDAGHFGGDQADNDWTQQLATLMASPAGATLYGDLAYWSKLRCAEPADAACVDARARLAAALQVPGVAGRALYGSDWLMLSREADWAVYPHAIAAAARDLLPAEALFGTNALACFGPGLQAQVAPRKDELPASPAHRGLLSRRPRT